MNELEQLIEQLKSLTESNGELTQTYKDFLRDQVISMNRKSASFEILGFGEDYGMQAWEDSGYAGNPNLGPSGLERDIQNRAFSDGTPDAVNDWQEIKNLQVKTQAHIDYLRSPEAAWGAGYIYSEANSLEWGEGVLDKDLADRQRRSAELQDRLQAAERQNMPHDSGTMADVVARANAYANAPDSDIAREQEQKLRQQQELDEALYQYNLDKHNNTHPFDVDNADVPGSNPVPDISANNPNLQKLVAAVGGAFIATAVGVMIVKGLAEKAMDFTDEVQSRNREYGSVSDMNFATTLRDVFKELRDIRLGTAEVQAATILTEEEEKRKMQTEEFRKQFEILKNTMGAVLERNLTEMLESFRPVIDAATEWMKKINIASGTYDPNTDAPSASAGASLLRWNQERIGKEAAAKSGWKEQTKTIGWDF